MGGGGGGGEGKSSHKIKKILFFHHVPACQVFNPGFIDCLALSVLHLQKFERNEKKRSKLRTSTQKHLYQSKTCFVVKYLLVLAAIMFKLKKSRCFES